MKQGGGAICLGKEAQLCRFQNACITQANHPPMQHLINVQNFSIAKYLRQVCHQNRPMKHTVYSCTQYVFTV